MGRDRFVSDHREPMGKRIGILGGTFNPIHIGHVRLAEAAREQLALDRVLLIPAAQPPHKAARELLPGAIRLKLIRLAIRGHPALVASDVELQRGGVSYTIDTVRALRRRRPHARFFLLIGHDMLRARWKQWTRLTRLCTVVVARRPGTRGVRRERGVAWLTMPMIDLASSDIRRRLRAGRSIRHLVPRPVERYLLRHRVFRPARGSRA